MSLATLLGAMAAAPTSDAVPPPAQPAPTTEPTAAPPPTLPSPIAPPPPPPPVTSSVAPPPPPPPVTNDPAPSPSPDPNPAVSKAPPKTKTTKSSNGSGTFPTGSPSSGGHSGGSTGGGSSGDGSSGTIEGGGNNNGTSTTDGSTSGSSPKSVIAPVIGGIAAVLVVGFLVGVFVMRYRKRSKANKRRLDILFDQNGQGQDQVHALGLGGAGAAASGKHGRASQSSVARPSMNEMSVIGGNGGTAVAAAAVHDGGYDHGVYHNDGGGYHHEGGYDHASAQQYPAPYAGYQQDPSQQPAYDAYDPYYGNVPASQQQQQQQQSGYYGDNRTSPALAYQQPYVGSPSMTHSSASPPSSYPQPPNSASPSPRMPLLQTSAKSPPQHPQTFLKNEMNLSGDYANSQSSARNPQIVAGDYVKLPR